MTKVEKVLRGLECCTTEPNEFGDCVSENCPYKRIDCFKYLLEDALALLKSYAEADLISRQSLWEHMNNLLPEPEASMMIWSKDVLAVIEEEEQWH